MSRIDPALEFGSVFGQQFAPAMVELMQAAASLNSPSTAVLIPPRAKDDAGADESKNQCVFEGGNSTFVGQEPTQEFSDT